MTFSTAISGINAATADLGVISNNIANASTTGFKASRAEFADVYATSLLGAGANAIGKGVSLAGRSSRSSARATSPLRTTPWISRSTATASFS
jgi:flagellar hook protein FlgE